MHFDYLNLLTEVLHSCDVDQTTLLQHAGLESLSLDENLNLNAGQLDSLFQSALALSEDPFLGIKFGAKINMVPQGILGYALITSATIGDALKLLVRYHRALLPSVRISLEQRQDSVALITHSPELDRALSQFYSEVIYAGVLTAGAMLLGGQAQHTSLRPPTLLLDYSAPGDLSLYHSVFGEKIEFDQGQRALCFNDENLVAPISTSNTVAQQVFKQECDRLLRHEANAELISEKVKRRLITSRLDFPNCADIAAQLHMSESTLRRSLHKEGWRFQELLDLVRHKLAMEYLTGTKLPVSEIASLLGFSDSANFRRAFKRWSNKTPSELRSNRVAQEISNIRN